jgi:hypothetical protein
LDERLTAENFGGKKRIISPLNTRKDAKKRQ